MFTYRQVSKTNILLSSYSLELLEGWCLWIYTIYIVLLWDSTYRLDGSFYRLRVYSLYFRRNFWFMQNDYDTIGTLSIHCLPPSISYLKVPGTSLSLPVPGHISPPQSNSRSVPMLKSHSKLIFYLRVVVPFVERRSNTYFCLF